jgi:hypothetical protein
MERLEALIAVNTTRAVKLLSDQVAGPQRDLHSGNDGGVFNEPLADLTKVLASLIDSRNNIQVRHFRLPPLHASERILMHRL